MCSRQLIVDLLSAALAELDGAAPGPQRQSLVDAEGVSRFRPDGTPLTLAEKDKIRATLLTVKEFSPGQFPVLPEHIPYGPNPGHRSLVHL